MATFLSDLNSVWAFLQNTFFSIFDLYTTMPVLMAVLAIWIIRKVFRIFDIIKG